LFEASGTGFPLRAAAGFGFRRVTGAPHPAAAAAVIRSEVGRRKNLAWAR